MQVTFSVTLRIIAARNIHTDMKGASYLSLMRISHLVKNALIFAPLAFSMQFTAENLLKSSIAFLAFSLVASSVYVLNDIFDVNSDRKHPRKKARPIASGAVSILEAKIFFAILLLLGVLVSSYLPHSVFAIISGYFLMNILYSRWLKRLPIIDVMIIATGFVLRILAGAAAIMVSLSPWILLCTFFGALFIAFGKRKGEISILKEDPHHIRNVLSSYHPDFLNQLLGTTAAVTIICYALYTIDSHTIERFQTTDLIYTIPFVVFGIFRYFQVMYTQSKGDDPTRIFSTDPPLLINMLLWGASFIYIVHLHS